MQDKNPFGSYYKTWLHWYLRKYELFGGGYWPERWALIPVGSFFVGLFFLYPLGWLTRKIAGDWSRLVWGETADRAPESWRLKVAKTIYFVYDIIKVLCVDRFSIFFVNETAKWPPPEINRNPVFNEETGAES